MLWYCNKCKEWKIHEDLYLKWKGQYRYECKECSRLYYQENKEDILKRNNQHYQENKEDIKQYKREFHQDNRDRQLESFKQYHIDNREYILLRSREYRYNNIDQERARNLNIRACKAGAPGIFIEEEFQEMLAFYDYKCLACGKELKNDNDTIRDHVIPFSKGGGNTIDNIQPLCRPCNTSKGNKTTDYRPNN